MNIYTDSILNTKSTNIDDNKTNIIYKDVLRGKKKTPL